MKCDFASLMLFHIILLLSLLLTRIVTCSSVGATQCAKLRSDEYPDQELTLLSGAVKGNLAEEYNTAERSWNVTGRWTVSQNCELNICKNTYLRKPCDTFGNTAGEGQSNSGSWLSGSCKCRRTCSCSNVVWREMVCARGYFHPTGCNTCDTSYTELHVPNPNPVTTFPHPWTNKIASFLVRPDCHLTVYSEGDHDGESQEITGPFVENWSGTVGSYECSCTRIENSTGTKPPPGNTNYPSAIELPDNIDEVVAKLRQNNYDHPGLLAAFWSLNRGRSARNAYILMIGSTGAGKSSAINMLLGNQNITLAGEDKSTTSEILEFRLSVPVDTLGVTNSELRIIDTPGLGDSRGIELDAQFLATLDDYLSGHDELKSNIPNLVLVFHKFTDNRFDGEAAKFVKMVRGLDTFRTRITDEHFSNVLFVFSHLCSELEQLQTNPAPRLTKFKEVIEQYSLFPKPIMTAVIENKPEQNDLVMVNDNYKLPNNEYFPANLVDKFNEITGKGGDKMGKAIVNAAFHNQFTYQPNMTETKFPLVNSRHSKVAKYLSILTAAAYNAASTDVSRHLAETFKNMDTPLKSQFPDSLQYLQQYLSIRNIRAVADIPKTTGTILQLLQNMKQNKATDYLLEKGLNLTYPSFPQTTVAGFGFNILKDSILSTSPFKMDQLQPSNIGFLVPKTVRCTTMDPPQELDLLRVFNTKQEYVNYRITSFGVNTRVINGTDAFTGLSGKVKEGFYVKDSSCNNNVCSITATRLYKICEFDLQSHSELQLHPTFVQLVTSIPPFNESNHENVERWNNFFKEYGSHVVTKALGGGRIDIHISGASTFPDNIKERVFKTIDFAKDLSTLISGEKLDPKAILPSGVSHSLTFRGGSQAYQTSDLTKLTLQEAADLMKNWRKSLTVNPFLYPVSVIPISNITQTLAQGIAHKIHQATIRLFTSSLVYIAPPPPTPDPKIMEAELERVRKENEERLKKLAEEKRKLEEQAERTRQAAIAAQRKREQEQRELEERRRREAQERQRREEAERQRMLRQQQEARERERLEAERREREHQERIRRIQQQEREAQERAEREWREWRNRIEEENRRRRSSCLKSGTKILLADYTEKPVESLKIGDVLLDMDLKPTRVLGISYEFLLTQRFYGFDNQNFFFTDTHLFVGENSGAPEKLKLYTTSTSNLFAQNPLLEYLNVENFDVKGSTKLLRFNHRVRVHNSSTAEDVEVFLEPTIYPPETPIYFIQVDSPTGTYFAEGFVCRHEIPPLQFWPNTISTLFSLFNTKVFETVAKMPYTLETIYAIDGISDAVVRKVQGIINKEILVVDGTPNLLKKNDTSFASPCQIKTLDAFDTESLVSQIFGNPTLAALAMELYGGSGKLMSKYLDNANVLLHDCNLAYLQDEFYLAIKDQIEQSLRKLS